MIDPKLCFSATREIVKIAKSISEMHTPQKEYVTEVDLYRYIAVQLNEITNNCSSDVRAGYTCHIANKFPMWIRDEAYKLIRLNEIKSTLTKMRSKTQTNIQTTPAVNN